MSKNNIIRFGSKSGKLVVIVSSIHGDELSGFLLLNFLIPKLRLIVKNMNLRFAIIPFVNLLGVKQKTRNQPILKKDLNRSFFEENPPAEIKNIIPIISKAKLVIDLHTFPNTRHAFTGLWFSDPKHKKTSIINLNLVRNLDPEIIWHLNFENNNSDKSGSLGQWLTSKDIPNFAIETETPEFLNSKLISSISKNIINTIKQLPTQRFKNTSKIRTMQRKVVFTPQNGIFIPHVKPLQKVLKGQILGRVSNFALDTHDILSPFSGQVVFCKHISFATKKDKLIGIGVEEKL